MQAVYMSEITTTTAMTSAFCDRTADNTYCADVTLFLHATSGGLSMTVAFFLHRFLTLYCFKYYLGSFSRCKTAFSPILYP